MRFAITDSHTHSGREPREAGQGWDVLALQRAA